MKKFMNNSLVDMAAPLITIITVCYNAEKDLEATITNVLGLNYENIEYIVIDGQSTDGTVSILKKYHEEIKYWISEPDNGIYDAMNKGWEKASDKSYILFLGAGDLVVNLPNMYNVQTDIIAGQVQIGNKYLFKPKAGFRLTLGNTIHHQALLIKKTVHPSAPFKTKFKTYADFDFNQRLLKSGKKIAIDPNFKSYAMDGGLSASFNKTESLSVIRSNYGWFYVLLAKIYYLLRHEV